MKDIRKLIATVLTFVMTLSMITITPVSAEENNTFKPDDDSYYAIVENTTGKAVRVATTGYGKESAVYVDGSISNYKVLNKSAFKVIKQSDGKYSFASVSNDENQLKCEGSLNDGIDFVFTLSTNEAKNKFTIEENEDGYKIKSDDNVYLGLGKDNRLEKVSDEKAATFNFEVVSVVDSTVYIESVKTGNLVTFENQSDENFAPIKVTGDKDNITDNERFNVDYIKNKDGIEDVVAFDSVSKPGYRIGSAKWNDDLQMGESLVGSTNGTAGWEAIVIEPIGDGQFALRDSKYGKYVAVNDNDELEGGYDESKEIPEEERFIIYNEQIISEVSNLKFNESTRTQTSIDFSWTKNKDLVTDIEVWAKAENELTAQRIETIVNTDSYTAKNLTPGMKYEFTFKFISGNGNIDSPDNPYTEMKISAKTRAGEKPTVPSNVQLEQKGQKFKITFDKSENATNYRILGSKSMLGDYTEVATTDSTSVEVDPVDSNDKYSNYYKVVALNNVSSKNDDLSNAEESDESIYVSLETNKFGRNVFFISPTDKKELVNDLLQKLFEQQNNYAKDAQFNSDHYAIYYKQGDYTKTDSVPVGFYTHVAGLGKTPKDVQLNNIEVPAYLDDRGTENTGNYWDDGGNNGAWRNATCNFWRSAENLSVTGEGIASVTKHDVGDQEVEGVVAKYSKNWHPEDLNWSVAQAAPLRRIYSTRNVRYDWSDGWASGGYTADCYFEKDAKTGAGQQYFTRNSVVKGDATGTTLNNFNIGVQSDSLPKKDSGSELIKGNGYTNWDTAADDGSQQVATNITETPLSKEKPFLFLDDDGEYKVFVPSLQKNTSGVSWGKGKANGGLGEGDILTLDNFYIATPNDTAKEINKQLDAGKNIFFTPGVYHAEETIKINKENTIVLGTGMATIIPDNEEAAMEVADVDGVTVSGLVFDAGAHSKYLLKVGKEGSTKGDKDNPTLLQDLFFRVGGTTKSLTKADNALVINSNNVLSDHFWIWRADHGAGVKWGDEGNRSDYGLTVNGNDVSCYALFDEHFNKNDTLWNGENGATYFYQNEKCYDPISQEDWMSHNGSVNGYAAYKVANNVKKHYAVGLGIYNVFIYTGPEYDASKVSIQLDNAIEVPNSEDVIVENACIQTFAKADGAIQKFNNIINGVGAGVSSGENTETGEVGEGWSRKFLLSYQNGTAKFGKDTVKKPGAKGFEARPGYISPKDWDKDDRGKFIGTEVETGVKQLGDDDLDLDELKTLVDNKKDENSYTADSYKDYLAVYNSSSKVLSKEGLMYATQEDIDKALKELKEAEAKLVAKVNKDELNKLYTDKKDLKETDYTADSWKAFSDALASAKAILAKEDASQEEVNQALAALQNAITGLKAVTNDNQGDNDNKGDNDNQGDNGNQGNNNNQNDSKDNSSNNGSQDGSGNQASDGNKDGQSAGDKSSTTKKSSSRKSSKSKVKTGDTMNYVPYALLAMAAAGGYCTLRKRSKED